MSNSRVLPSLAEFQRALKDYRRQELAGLGLFAGALIGGVVILGVILWLNDPPLHERQNYLFGFTAIFIGGLIWGAVQSTRALKQNTLLHCCRCSQELQLQSGIVIATGNCPHCGQPAIEIPSLPAIDDPLPPRMTRHAFQQAVEQKLRTKNKYFYLGAVGVFAIVLVSNVTFFLLQGSQQNSQYVFVPAILFIVLVLPWLFWLRHRAQRPQPRDELLKCPNCCTDLASNIVSATGKCQSCRRAVFTDSPASLAALQENPLA